MKTEIQQLADQCVKCGLCLTKCPTYQLTANESESPRGRIAIIQALDSGTIEPTAKGRAHLEHCLQCMACESVCPAEVSYGKLIDAGMAAIEKTKAPSLADNMTKKLSSWYFNYPTFRSVLAKLLYLYQITGIQWLCRKSRILKALRLNNLDRLIPKLNLKLKPSLINKTKSSQGTRVYFHTGCVADNFDKETCMHAIKLLTEAGFDVISPHNQSCCGALQQHSGDTLMAKKLKNKTESSFEGAKAIISSVSGCASFMEEQGLPVFELMSFFIDKNIKLKLPALDGIKSIYFQEPCTHRNKLKSSQKVREFIKSQLPTHISLIEDSPDCCGAAGTQMIRQANTAIELGKRKHALIERPDETLVLTTNLGCSLHLRALPGMKELSITHPLQIFEIAGN